MDGFVPTSYRLTIVSPPRPYPGWEQTVCLAVSRGQQDGWIKTGRLALKDRTGENPTRKADRTHRQQTTDGKKAQSAQEADETVDAGKRAGLAKVKDN